MIWTIIAVLVILWLLGLVGNVGGWFINVLLVIALALLIYHLASGRRTM